MVAMPGEADAKPEAKPADKKPLPKDFFTLEYMANSQQDD